MNVTYHEALRDDGPLFALARQATRRLEEVRGPFAGWSALEWDRGEDEGGAVVVLTLAGAAASVTARLAPQELVDPIRMRLLLQQLWADVVRGRRDAQVGHLLEDARRREQAAPPEPPPREG